MAFSGGSGIVAAVAMQQLLTHWGLPETVWLQPAAMMVVTLRRGVAGQDCPASPDIHSGGNMDVTTQNTGCMDCGLRIYNQSRDGDLRHRR